MTTPYNTGKVQIGIAYQRPLANLTTTKDMVRLQAALLSTPAYVKARKARLRSTALRMTDSALWAASLGILVALVLTPNFF